MQTTCPDCSSIYDVDPQLAGQSVQCQCGATFTVPLEIGRRPGERRETPDAVRSELEAIRSQRRTRKCPMCGEEILPEAKKCKHCGEYLGKDGAPLRRVDRLVYVVLGLFLGGIGVHNFYAGQTASGLIKILVLVFGVPLCALGRGDFIYLPFVLNGLWTIIDICRDPNQAEEEEIPVRGGERKRLFHPAVLAGVILGVLALAAVLLYVVIQAQPQR